MFSLSPTLSCSCLLASISRCPLHHQGSPHPRQLRAELGRTRNKICHQAIPEQRTQSPQQNNRPTLSPPTQGRQVGGVSGGAMMTNIPIPVEYTIVNPVCFISCKYRKYCQSSFSFTLPHAIENALEIDKDSFKILSMITCDVSS